MQMILVYEIYTLIKFLKNIKNYKKTINPKKKTIKSYKLNNYNLCV